MLDIGETVGIAVLVLLARVKVACQRDSETKRS